MSLSTLMPKRAPVMMMMMMMYLPTSCPAGRERFNPEAAARP
jgi:hypothetical protein